MGIVIRHYALVQDQLVLRRERAMMLRPAIGITDIYVLNTPDLKFLIASIIFVDIGEVQGLDGCRVYGLFGDRVLFPCRRGFYFIRQLDVQVERIIFRGACGPGDTGIDGYRQSGFLGQEFAGVDIGSHVDLLVVFQRSLICTLVDGPPTGRLVAARDREGTQVGELHVDLADGRPAPLLADVCEPQLVEPDFGTGVGSIYVLYTQEEGLDRTQVGITKDGIRSPVGIDFLVIIIGTSLVVSVHFQLDKATQGQVEVIAVRPDNCRLRGCVLPPGSDHNRHTNFIVVGDKIAAQANDIRKIVVIERSLCYSFRVHEHVHGAVTPEVKVGGLVHTAHVALHQVTDLQAHRLFVEQ